MGLGNAKDICKDRGWSLPQPKIETRLKCDHYTVSVKLRHILGIPVIKWVCIMIFQRCFKSDTFNAFIHACVVDGCPGCLRQTLPDNHYTFIN